MNSLDGSYLKQFSTGAGQRPAPSRHMKKSDSAQAIFHTAQFSFLSHTFQVLGELAKQARLRIPSAAKSLKASERIFQKITLGTRILAQCSLAVSLVQDCYKLAKEAFPKKTDTQKRLSSSKRKRVQVACEPTSPWNGALDKVLVVSLKVSKVSRFIFEATDTPCPDLLKRAIVPMWFAHCSQRLIRAISKNLQANRDFPEERILKDDLTIALINFACASASVFSLSSAFPMGCLLLKWSSSYLAFQNGKDSLQFSDGCCASC